MPRKVPAAYLRKLNEQLKHTRLNQAKQIARKTQPQDPDSGKLKGFTSICQACGSKSRFIVDSMGYATCQNCRAIANYRFGNLA